MTGSYGHSARATLEVRLAAEKQIQNGAVMRIIEEGVAATRRATENTRAIATRKLPTNAMTVVDTWV